MWILEVIPIKRGLPKETLTYFSAEPVADGSVVSVPVRTRLVDALVIDSKDARAEKANIKEGAFALRKISSVKKNSPVPPFLFQTATLAGRYYRASRGTMLDLIVSDLSAFADFESESHKTLHADVTEIQPERLIFQGPLEERVSYYRTYTREAFAKKESVTFVLPTIADCELFTQALSRGIADFVIPLHSELPKKKFADSMKRLGGESHPLILICTPSYASLLRPDTKTIILEHESSGAYTTPSNPSYDFRVLIEILARTSGRKLILGDSLLRVETLGRQEAKEFGTLAPITFRALAPIDVSVIAHGIPDELPTRLRNEQVPALSEEARTILSSALEKRSHIFCFALRTGLSTFTRCRDCGQVLLCEYCTAPLVLYQHAGERRIFICNKCKRHRPSDAKCARCGSWNLSALGTGTAFIEEEIKRLFPDLPVFRIDRETASTRAEARKIASQFAASPGGVLIGTEMALYYISDDVDNSVVVSFDTLFNIPSYRTNERIIDLFLAIALRTKGKLYIQTRDPHEPIIELIQSNNYASWYRSEIKEREEYLYPPFSTIIKITWKGKDSEKDAARDYIADVLAPFSPDMFESIVVTKGKRESAINAVIRPRRDEWSLSALQDGKGLSEVLREALAKLPPETIISINPDNLL